MKKSNLATIISKYKETIGERPHLPWILLFILVLGLACFLTEFYKKSDEPKPAGNLETVDTLIPEGKELVTIEIINYESLDHIVGQFGVVNLYAAPMAAGEKAKLVLSNTKIIRAPNNPNHFNALLSAQEALIVASYPGEFIAGVRNPKKNGTKIVKSNKRHISYEWE